MLLGEVRDIKIVFMALRLNISTFENFQYSKLQTISKISYKNNSMLVFSKVILLSCCTYTLERNE